MSDIAYAMENLGKQDPEYGGVLTDASTLPVGTTFYVRNGAWYGRIVEAGGRRCIQPGLHLDASGKPAGRGLRPVPLWPEGDERNILSMTVIKRPDGPAG